MLHRPRHSLGPHDVHVWHLLADDLTDPGALHAIYALLTTDEQDRMARLKHENDRRLFLLSRGLMRTVLASYLGCRSRDVRFAVSNHGKPILHSEEAPVANAHGSPNLNVHGSPNLSDSGSPALHFNLTHSRGAVAFAVSSGREVGIDIEQREREVEYLALAKRYFAAAEAQHLLELREEQRSEAFFAIWTLKEAFVKGIGRGLSFPLDAFCFDLEVHRLLRFRPLADFVSPDWHFHQFELGERHCGAIAVHRPAGSEVQIEMREWCSAFMG